jgi:hypothetical protein
MMNRGKFPPTPKKPSLAKYVMGAFGLGSYPQESKTQYEAFMAKKDPVVESQELLKQMESSISKSRELIRQSDVQLERSQESRSKAVSSVGTITHTK